MKVTKLAIMIAMASGLSAATAFGQSGLRQPTTVSRTGFEYGSYDYYAADEPAASPSAPAAAPASAPAPAATCDTCGTSSCNTCCDPYAGCELECPEGCEPWRLFDCCCLKSHDVTLNGWISGGIMGNADSPADHYNGPMTFADRDDGQMNQLYMIAERAIDTGGCGWDLGGRVDLLYGSDYRFTLARGLDARDDFTAKWDSSRFYGLAMPQAYVEVGYNDLSVKIGHFYTIIGYEVVPAPGNFFYTHAYTMQYGEPFTHTGALATWAANDQLTLMGGFTFGWDNFDNYFDRASFLGGATFTSSDGNSSLAYALTVGDEGLTANAVNTRYMQSIVYSRTLTDRLSYVFQSDYGHQDPTADIPENASWYGVNQYLFYKINCCWSAGLRAEWFRDDDGFRVAPVGDYAATGQYPNSNPASIGGFEGNFYEITAGLNYKPSDNPNFVFRPEIRYDWYSGNPSSVNGTTLPYDGGTSTDQLTYGFDMIYLY